MSSRKAQSIWTADADCENELADDVEVRAEFSPRSGMRLQRADRFAKASVTIARMG